VPQAGEEQVAAQERARQLLLSLLTPQQRQTFEDIHRFRVETAFGVFELGRIGDIGFSSRAGHKYRLCVLPRGARLPYDDIWANLLLFLQHDSATFLKVANWRLPSSGSWHRGPVPGCQPDESGVRRTDSEPLAPPQFDAATLERIRLLGECLRRRAVALVFDRHHSIEDVARDVSVIPATVEGWVSSEQRRRREAEVERRDRYRVRFQREVAALVLDRHHSIEYVAERLLLRPGAVSNWVQHERRRRVQHCP